jgi:transposase
VENGPQENLDAALVKSGDRIAEDDRALVGQAGGQLQYLPLPPEQGSAPASWALIEPVLAEWRKARIDRRPTGIPAPTGLRDIFNAILYVNRTGIAWKYLPHDFPPHGTVYSYYAAWRDGGIFARLGCELTALARVKEGRKPGPTAAVIDTQSIKNSTNVPVTSHGTDAGKKIVGRKRGISNQTPSQDTPCAELRHRTGAHGGEQVSRCRSGSVP